MLLIAEAGPLAAGRIAEAIAITTGAVTGLVDRLERAGWVQRTRHDTDRRQVLVELAPARRDAIEAHAAAREQLVAGTLADADDAAVGAMVERLDAIAEALATGARELARDAAAADAAADDGVIDDGERAPIGTAERGRLRFTSGVSRLELRGSRIRDLYRASFEGKRPRVTVDADGTVAFQYKGLSWFGARGVGAQVTLTTAVPWSIEIRGGVSHLAADLRELEVTEVVIGGGATQSELMLPRPRGTGTVRVTGGASRFVIRRPRGTAVQAYVRGGASNLVFDDQRLGAVGSATRLATPGWEAAPDRWAIELTGGASDLSVVED